MRTPLVLAVGLSALCAVSCAEIPPHRYGLDELRFSGVHALDAQALKACLATQPRDKLTLGLAALRNPSCGEPPFDQPRAAKRLFAWGWTDWPIYDEAIFKLDLERISRWYRARGYYDARILDVRYDPESAKKGDQAQGCPEGCPLDVTVVIDEGAPVKIRKVALKGIEGLAPKVQRELRRALTLEPQQVFDEAIYDQTKEALARALREHGYARAAVEGDVVVSRAERRVDVTFQLQPGPICTIGKVRVDSREPVPTGPILAATLLHEGQLYRESELDDAQRAVYALGAFSAVTVRGDLDTPEPDRVDVVIEVEPRRKSQVQLGAGIMSGVLATGAAAADQFSVPQWDVHLLGSYEHRNFLGGLRRLRIEERPRVLFLGSFPRVPISPRFGNLIQASFHQPGVIEPRTTLFVEFRHDYGPDPFQLFFRNDLGVAVGLERRFWKHQVTLRGAVHQEFMLVGKRQPILRDQYPQMLTPENTDPKRIPGSGCAPYGQEAMDGQVSCARTYDEVVPATYYLPFLEQRVTVDLRDDPANPSRGAYFSLSVHEAARVMPKTWNYVRVMPDVRGYVPLGLGMVLAARFSVGALFVFSASKALDEGQQFLGPQSYRLRGGGAQGNRGFLPRQLGDSQRGGTRSWESSLELRIPLAKDFSVVAFGDMGDVYGPLSQHPRFRFDHLNTAVGGGLRYRTIVGPIRLDVGYRVPGAQRAGGGPGENDRTDLGFTRFHGAIHLTIGEAF